MTFETRKNAYTTKVTKDTKEPHSKEQHGLFADRPSDLERAESNGRHRVLLVSFVVHEVLP